MGAGSSLENSGNGCDTSKLHFAILEEIPGKTETIVVEGRVAWLSTVRARFAVPVLLSRAPFPRSRCGCFQNFRAPFWKSLQ